MKVATTAIQAAIYGAERDCVKERSDWITPSRFSEKQIRTFSKKPSLTAGFGRESFLLHSAATAGITLDFMTNSAWLAFEYRGFAASNRQICWFDILVTGRMKRAMKELSINQKSSAELIQNTEVFLDRLGLKKE